MTAKITSLAGLVLFLLSFDATAQRVRLSDSLSPQQNYVMDLAWQPNDLNQFVAAMMRGQESSFPPMRGFLPGVELRLNTAEYLNRKVRIYLVLPATIVADPSSGTLELSWQVSGDFLPGSARAGQETLIFEGTVVNEITAGTFNFMLQIQDGGSQDALLIEPYYELEVLL